MTTRTKRTIAVVGSGLMVAGLAVAGASPASAQDRRGHDDCDVDVRQRGDEIRVDIDADNGRVAFVRANFDRGRDDSDRVRLDRRGEGDTEFDIPRRADWVRVTVFAGGDVCSDTLRLRDHDRGHDRDGHDDDRGGRH